MQLLDKSKLGLVIWGTKRGKSVFLSSNLAESTEELNRQLLDIQSYTSFQRVNHEFYCFDHNHGFKAVSIIYSINDALSRIGYLAVTLVIPNDKTFRENQNHTCKLLKDLLQLYMDKYVVSDYVTKTINPSIREDVGLFENLLNNSRCDWVPAENSPVAAKASVNTCYLQFRDEDDLNEIFQHYDRDELRPYDKVFVLPNIQNDLTANINFTTLPRAEKKVTLKIRTLGEDGILYGVTLALNGEKTGSKRISCDGETSIVVPRSEKMSIVAEFHGYKSRSVYEHEVSNAINNFPAVLTINLEKIPQPKPKPKPPVEDTGSGWGSTIPKEKPVDRRGSKMPADPNKYKWKYLGIIVLVVAALTIAGYFILRSSGPDPANPTQPTDNAAFVVNKARIDSAMDVLRKKVKKTKVDTAATQRFIESMSLAYTDSSFQSYSKALLDSLVPAAPVDNNKPVRDKDTAKEVVKPPKPPVEPPAKPNMIDDGLAKYAQKLNTVKIEEDYNKAQKELQIWYNNAGNKTPAQESKYQSLINQQEKDRQLKRIRDKATVVPPPVKGKYDINAILSYIKNEDTDDTGKKSALKNLLLPVKNKGSKDDIEKVKKALRNRPDWGINFDQL